MHTMQLDPKDKDKITTFYTDHLKRFGPDSGCALGWPNSYDQQIRFSVLVGIADMTGMSVLDVGCGLGDFFAFLTRHWQHTQYEGVDIVEPMIESAKEKYPHARFRHGDVYLYEESSFDFVFSSGAMSLKISDNKKIYTDIIHQMYRVAIRGVAFNMLYKGRHIDDDLYCTYNPDEIYDMCKTFCDHVELVVDYLPEDFTIYLTKKE